METINNVVLPSEEKNLKVYLYGATGLEEDFKGELIINSPVLSLKLDTLPSTFTFTIPMKINGKNNPRISEVVIGSVIEVQSVTNTVIQQNKMRFIIASAPRSIDTNGIISLSFTAQSLENELNNYNIVNWPGIQLTESYNKKNYEDLEDQLNENNKNFLLNFSEDSNLININENSLRLLRYDYTVSRKTYSDFNGDIELKIIGGVNRSCNIMEIDIDYVTSENNTYYIGALKRTSDNIFWDSDEEHKNLSDYVVPSSGIDVDESFELITKLVSYEDMKENQTSDFFFEEDKIKKVVYIGHVVGENEEEYEKSLFIFIDTISKTPLVYSYLKANSLDAQIYSYYYTSEKTESGYTLSFPNIKTDYSLPFFLDPSKTIGELIFSDSNNIENFSTILTTKNIESMFITFYRIKEDSILITDNFICIDATEDSDVIVSSYDNDIGLYKYYSTEGLNAKEVLNNLFNYTNYSELSWIYDNENNTFSTSNLSNLKKNWTVEYSSDIDSSIYYSNLSITGQTLLQAIVTVMGTFNLVPIIDTINKVFYMFKRNINFQNNNSFEYAKDTGLSLQSDQYIQSIQQQIENQVLTTVLTANGADNLTLDGMVANSNGEIEDYSYYLGDFEITNIEEVLFTPGTEIEVINEDSLVLIQKEFAIKLLLWSYIRDIAQYEVDGGLILPYQSDDVEVTRYGLGEYYVAAEDYSYKKAELIEANRQTALAYYSYYLNAKNSYGEIHNNILVNNLESDKRFYPTGINFNFNSKYISLSEDGTSKVFSNENITVYEDSTKNEEFFGLKELSNISFNLSEDIVPIYKNHNIILPTFRSDFNNITSFTYDLDYTGYLSDITVAIRLGTSDESFELLFNRIMDYLKVECIPVLSDISTEYETIPMAYLSYSGNTVYFKGSIAEADRNSINKIKFNIGLDPLGNYAAPEGEPEFGTILKELSYKPLNYSLTFDYGYTGRYLFQYNLMSAKYLLSSEDVSSISSLSEGEDYSKEQVWLYEDEDSFIDFVKTQPLEYLNYRYKYMLNSIRKDNFAEYLVDYYSKFGEYLIGTSVNYDLIKSQQFDESDYKILETIRKAKIYNNTNISSSEYLYILAKEEMELVNKPAVSLTISSVDILELNNYNYPLYVGEMINIYYPELNVDIAAQIKTLTWSPESNSLALTISTLRNNENSSVNYKKASLRKMRLQSESDSLKNSSITTSGSSSISSTTVYAGTSASENSGAFSEFGEYSISIDGDKISIINSAKEETIIADKNGLKAGSLNGNIIIGQKTTITSDKNSGAIALGEIDSETGEYGLEILGSNKNKLKMGDQTGISIENATGDLVMNSDVDGNLTLTGKIYAEGGEFIGDVSAGNVTIGPSGITVVNENGEITFEADINGNIISKGDITGSAGAFGPILLDENGISSENFSINTDGTASFSGRIKASGGYFTGEVQAGNTIIGPVGIKSLDNNGNTTFEIDENGDAFFKGDLTASSGTFGPVVLDENGMEILSDNNEIAFKAGANGNIYFKGELVRITNEIDGPSLENLILDDGTRTLDMETVLVDTKVGVLQFGVSNSDNSQFHTQLKNGLTIRKFSEAELSIPYDFSGESFSGFDIISGKRTDLYEGWLGHINNINQTIMTLDPVTGDLKLKGELTATSGSFTGEVSVGNNLIIGPHGVDEETYSIYSPNFKITEDGDATFSGTIVQGASFQISSGTVAFEDKATNFTVDIINGYNKLYYDENKILQSENLSAFQADVRGDGISLISNNETYRFTYSWSCTNQLTAQGSTEYIEFIPTPDADIVDKTTIEDSEVTVTVQIKNSSGVLVASVQDTVYVKNIIFGELTYMNSLGQTGEAGADGKSVNIKGEAYLTSGTIEDYDSNSLATTLSSTATPITYITGAIEGDSYLVEGSLFVYVSDNILSQSLFKWVGEIQGPQGEDGKPGPVGDQGSGIVYRGIYDSDKIYYHNLNRKDLVSYIVNDTEFYYIVNNTDKDGESTWSFPTSDDWKSFGAQFSSVATDLILANDIFVSKTINIGESDSKPVIALSGAEASISINGNGDNSSSFVVQNKVIDENTSGAYLFIGNDSSNIEFDTNTLTINTDNLSLNASGDVKLKGDITATSGTFSGDIKVGSNIYIGEHIVDTTHYDFYSPNFKVKADGSVELEGAITATSGTFSGNLDAAGGTFSGDLSAASGIFGPVTLDSDGISSNYFSIDSLGKIIATGGSFKGSIIADSLIINDNATITKTLTMGSSSEKGAIASYGMTSLTDSTGGFYMDGSGKFIFGNYNSKYVSWDGNDLNLVSKKYEIYPVETNTEEYQSYVVKNNTNLNITYEYKTWRSNLTESSSWGATLSLSKNSEIKITNIGDLYGYNYNYKLRVNYDNTTIIEGSTHLIPNNIYISNKNSIFASVSGGDLISGSLIRSPLKISPSYSQPIFYTTITGVISITSTTGTATLTLDSSDGLFDANIVVSPRLDSRVAHGVDVSYGYALSASGNTSTFKIVTDYSTETHGKEVSFIITGIII